jgi:hypothetical protein
VLLFAVLKSFKSYPGYGGSGANTKTLPRSS